MVVIPLRYKIRDPLHRLQSVCYGDPRRGFPQHIHIVVIIAHRNDVLPGNAQHIRQEADPMPLGGASGHDVDGPGL